MATQVDTSIASISALLSDFVDFAVAEAGFTDEGTDTHEGETLYKISRTTDTFKTYWGFVYHPVTSGSYGDEQIECRMMLSEPTTSNWDTVADGQRLKTRWDLYDYAATYTGYKFYTDGTNVFAAVEVRTGLFTHLAIGNITKCETFDGGEFLQADHHGRAGGVYNAPDEGSSSSWVFSPSNASSTGATTSSRNYIRYNTGGSDNTDFFPSSGRIDNVDNPAQGSGSLSPSSGDTAGNGAVGSVLSTFDPWGRVIESSPSATTNISPIMPVFVTRKVVAEDKQRIIGHIPNIGAIGVGSLAPAELVNTDWEVYPKSQKVGDSVVAAVSGNWGLAYRII